MGLIRSSLVITVSTALFLSLFLGNAFLTLSWSLEYDNVQPQITSFATDMMTDAGFKQSIEENKEYMKIYCTQYDSFIYSEDGIVLELPCEIIAQGADAIITYGVSTMIEDLYYKTYECSFWECLKKDSQPFVLVSEKSLEYWSNLYFYAIFASVIIFLLLLLVIEAKHSTLTITGILMIVAAFPFRKLNWVLGLLPDGGLTDLFLALFAKSYNVFLIMTIIGASLFAIGIGFEFLGFGLWISKLIGVFKKDKKKKAKISLAEIENDKKFSKEEVKEIVKEALVEEEKEKKKEKSSN